MQLDKEITVLILSGNENKLFCQGLFIIRQFIINIENDNKVILCSKIVRRFT